MSAVGFLRHWVLARSRRGRSIPQPVILRCIAPYVPSATPTAEPDHVDAELTRLWNAHREHFPDLTWEQLITMLSAANAELGRDILRLRKELSGFQHNTRFIP